MCPLHPEDITLSFFQERSCFKSKAKTLKEKDMNHLRSLGSVVVLVLAFVISATAGETSVLACPVPGQIDTPPCSSAPASSGDENLVGQTETPPVSDSVDVYALAEMALQRLLLF
jgi:hypothetical protein